MSLMACPECSKQVSTKALLCPHCGFIIYEYIQQQHEEIPHQETKQDSDFGNGRDDRRKNRRISRFDSKDIRRKARLKINNELALLIDLSRDGLRFSMADIPKKPEITIILQIENQTYELTGSIRWYSKSKSFINFKEVGTSIKSAPETFYRLIDNLEN